MNPALPPPLEPTAVTPLVSVGTGFATRKERLLPTVPLPNSPLWLSPQHRRPPPATTEHALPYPMPTKVAFERLRTVVGLGVGAALVC
jgi:hypothetical protein